MLEGRLSIDISSVPDFDNVNNSFLIIYRVDHPIMSLSHSIKVGSSGKFFSPLWARLGSKCFNLLNQSS